MFATAVQVQVRWASWVEKGGNCGERFSAKEARGAERQARRVCKRLHQHRILMINTQWPGNADGFAAGIGDPGT